MFEKYEYLFGKDVVVEFRDGDKITGHWSDWTPPDDEEAFIVVDTDRGPIGIYESEVKEIKSVQ